MRRPAAPSNPPRRRAPLRWVIAAGLVLALAAAGHAALWRHAVDRLATAVADWTAARRLAGWRVEAGPPQRDGWPFAAVLHLPRPRLERPGDGRQDSLGWEAEAVTIRLAPVWSPRLAIVPAGRQRVRVGAFELPFAADRLELSVPVDGGPAPREGELLADRLRLGTPGGGIELRRLTAAVTSMRTAVEGEDALAVRLAASDLALPPTLGAAFGVLGRDIAAVTGELAVTGPWPRGDGAAARAAGWRDGGGSLHLRDVTVDWGPIAARGNATLALDETLQPMGAGTLRVAGGAALIEAAAAAGLLPPRGIETARMVLRLLERPAADGGRPELEVPATLERRTLSLARIPVARLPALAWPDGEQR